MTVERTIETHTSVGLIAAEAHLGHRQIPACVIEPVEEVIGKDTVIHGFNAYFNNPAWQYLRGLYPDRPKARITMADQIMTTINGLTDSMPEFERPTVVVFQGNPKGKTHLARSKGISLGFIHNPDPSIAETLVASLFQLKK